MIMKKSVKTRYVINLEFDGFFYDDELNLNLMGNKQQLCTMLGQDQPHVL